MEISVRLILRLIKNDDCSQNTNTFAIYLFNKQTPQYLLIRLKSDIIRRLFGLSGLGIKPFLIFFEAVFAHWSSKPFGFFSTVFSTEANRRSTFLTSSDGGRLSGRMPRLSNVFRTA